MVEKMVTKRLLIFDCLSEIVLMRASVAVKIFATRVFNVDCICNKVITRSSVILLRARARGKSREKKRGKKNNDWYL